VASIGSHSEGKRPSLGPREAGTVASITDVVWYRGHVDLRRNKGNRGGPGPLTSEWHGPATAAPALCEVLARFSHNAPGRVLLRSAHSSR